MVSVYVLTYNHQQFIEKCLQGILNQQFNNTYEIVIADNNSTDNTLNIIKHYQDKHPGLITVISQPKAGIFNNVLHSFFTLKGKYVALLEGDDCWVNPKKLATQFEFLEQNSNFILHSYNALEIDIEQNTQQTFSNKYYIPETVSMHLLIEKDRLPASALFFRNNFNTALVQQLMAQVSSQVSLKWLLCLGLALSGKVAFNNQVAVNRYVHAKGISKVNNNSHFLNENIKVLNYMLRLPEFKTYKQAIKLSLAARYFNLYFHSFNENKNSNLLYFKGIYYLGCYFLKKPLYWFSFYFKPQYNYFLVTRYLK